jgi:hypothetical protein
MTGFFQSIYNHASHKTYAVEVFIFSSVYPDQCQGTTLKQAMTTSFLIYSLTIQC